MRAEASARPKRVLRISAAILVLVYGGGWSAAAPRREAKPTAPTDVAGSRGVPRCFGAAARDPERGPCTNRGLRYSVVPTPSDALMMTNSRCTIVGRSRSPEVCASGVAADRARASVALVGD